MALWTVDEELRCARRAHERSVRARARQMRQERGEPLTFARLLARCCLACMALGMVIGVIWGLLEPLP